jgi:hypothetical protein
VQKRHRGASSELLAVDFLWKHDFEVFRNQSQHGPIDLIAIKSSTETQERRVLFLDLKTCISSAERPLYDVSLTPEQKALGVKLLWVSHNGSVFFGMPGDGTP